MPARRDRSLAEYQAKEARERAQSALRSRRYRARTRDARTRDGASVTVTDAAPSGGHHAHPPTPPVSSSSLLEKRETKKIEHLLSGFAPRGYAHDGRFWELMRQRHPRLDLELEVMKISEWLDEPRNAKRKCSKGFLSNWLGKADVDRQQREAQARLAPLPAPPTRAPGRPPDPEPVLPPDVTLERIDPRVAERHLLEAKRYTLDEKLAMARNGKH